MAVQITGMIRRRIIADLSVGVVLGFAGAAYWWWGFHKGKVQVRENYYTQLAEKKKAEESV
ncbi:hypothetical protein PACTADRAFT_66962 [Pachysolen tannophilus NRRL Y-2460]|uniref:Cytochrome c oxidase subunit 9, mitochondrial n=1 Tax=Pachysolen tannophilus NRRL Y-2460 TaxID=669874 RepID=A0A1E4TW24_PACTA|nr:hypothetical protein PACTADRAFT_66962 [Pachysolen tannophilus NRRL Y-2460]